ncbi:Mov34/MPN/PAD-1 family protein [Deinococcus kurensis]|uniref:Mov34/MPN/PAD-1 family protein n=1 Tax=Deinococcus kurensis TaxID=2662757 RepID=UPI0012D361DB|nr:Mov34/MPN/PAD-1 family protein [Deinococcus kurensis]
MTLTLHVPIPYDPGDPHEQAGILFGTPGHARLITGPLPLDQRGPDWVTLADPGHAHAAALAQAQGWAQIGYWHSHPPGTPFGPSEVDITDWQAALDTLGQPFLDFPIVTGGITHVYRLTPGHAPQEVAWISPPPDQTS